MIGLAQSTSTEIIGQNAALLAALTWALALVFFKRCGEEIKPLALNLYKNVIGIALLALTLAAMREGIQPLMAFPIEDIYILVLSGVVGIAIADTLMFHSLNRVGVGLFVVVDCAYSPIVLFVSWLILSVELHAVHYIGGALILAGILISSRHPPPPGRTRREIVAGMLYGVLAILLMAVGIVVAKPVLDVNGFPLVWGTTIRLVAGTVTLALLAAASPKRRVLWSVFRPSAIWKYAVPASILGGYLSMVFWVAGFKYASAPIAAVLNQTSVIFAIIFAAFILKERLSRRKLAAVGLALAGVLLVTQAAFVERLLR